MRQGVNWKMIVLYVIIAWALILLTGSFLMSAGIFVLLFALEYVIEYFVEQYKKNRKTK
uniref:Lmo0937 family membrane protein n=1 Tax=Prevotella sp. GTC17260 TaxID=3236796 RepID=A0AB33JE00_9BACT